MKQHTLAAFVCPGDVIMVPSVDSKYRHVNAVCGNIGNKEIWLELEAATGEHLETVGVTLGLNTEVVIDKRTGNISSIDALAPQIYGRQCIRDYLADSLEYARFSGSMALDDAGINWRDYERRVLLAADKAEKAAKGEMVPMMEAYLLVRGEQRLIHKVDALTKEDLAAFEKIGFTIYPLVKYVEKR